MQQLGEVGRRVQMLLELALRHEESWKQRLAPAPALRDTARRERQK
jgi:hypothetical protein